MDRLDLEDRDEEKEEASLKPITLEVQDGVVGGTSAFNEGD